MPKFADIPQLIGNGSYRVDIPWTSLEFSLKPGSWGNLPLDMDPDFQRAHVWTEDKQIAYVEYVLRGGTSGKEIYTNCPNFQRGGTKGPFVLVDGKQRLTAALRFLRDEIPAFGARCSEYSDTMRFTSARFSWWVNELESRADVLRWYLALNSGGVVHTQYELDKVRDLLAAEGEPAAQERG